MCDIYNPDQNIWNKESIDNIVRHKCVISTILTRIYETRKVLTILYDINVWYLQSWPEYMRQTLVWMWNSIDKGFILIGRLGTRLKFYEDLRTSQYFLSLKSLGNSWGSSCIPCLLLIITIRFTCGKRKISWNNKNSQTIMTKIAAYR